MHWGCKAVLNAITVVLILAIVQSLGRRAAGLPTVTGPVLVWLALECCAKYTVEAAAGSFAACALFVLAYERAIGRSGVLIALTTATAASLLPAAPLHRPAAGVLPTLLMGGAASLAAWTALPDGAEATPPVSRLRGELLLTATANGAVSGIVALRAPAVGPFWADVLALPPVIAAVVAMHQQVFVGQACVRRFLRGYVAGLAGRAMFGAGFALLLAPVEVASAALLATAAGCAFSLAVIRGSGRRLAAT